MLRESRYRELGFSKRSHWSHNLSRLPPAHKKLPVLQNNARKALPRKSPRRTADSHIPEEITGHSIGSDGLEDSLGITVCESP
jgi:hypothetical protein